MADDTQPAVLIKKKKGPRPGNRRGGMPAHQKTDALMQMAKSFGMVGVPHHMAARLMDISLETLVKYYSEELADGKSRSSFAIAKTLYGMAVGDPENGIPPNLSAAIYWTKSQMGWREASIQQHQMIDKDGNPVNVGPQYTVSPNEVALLTADLDEKV